MTTNQLADEISKKKSGVLKWILLGCAGLVIIVVAALGVIGYLAYKTFNTDPAEAELAAQEILPLDIPAGFSGRFSMSMMGMKMATLGSSDDSRIVLMVMPRSKASPEAMRKQMLDNLARQGQAQAEYGERRASEARVDCNPDDHRGDRRVSGSVLDRAEGKEG